MKKNYVVGNVITIDGLRITVQMRENSNMLSYFYDGETYRGVNIGEYVGIIRGPYKIVGRVEKEYLEDKSRDYENQTFELNRFTRKVELSIIGSFFNEVFEFGIKCFPMIFNEVVLLNDLEIRQIIHGSSCISNNTIPLGKSIQEQITIELQWDQIFNTHFGIFGNTGSGKSNTLAKIYTELFKANNKSIQLEHKSKFLFIDFNGEYMGPDTLTSEKNVINLSTNNITSNKFKITPESFWDIETLSILFSATEKTQRPFLQNAINFYVNKDTNDIDAQVIIDGICMGFRNVFKGNNHKEALELLKKVYQIIGISVDESGFWCDEDGEMIEIPWINCLWHSKAGSFYYHNRPSSDIFISGMSDGDVNEKSEILREIISCGYILEKIEQLKLIDKLIIIVNLQLIYGLHYNNFQFEHVNPLLSRIQSRSNFLDKIIEVGPVVNEKTVMVISMKNCNLEAKKIIPLLVAKQEYNTHKKLCKDDEKIDHTFHLIIDEAHNILSEQSNREEGTWKDYRLEVFEEIIKEGRKFGFYLTIASQRPYDISSTIISQLHNFFLHRLVNDLDLKMIANTLSSLDSLSRQRLSSLTPGQCIITGTSFEMPLLVQVERLDDNEVPNSDSADLAKLWRKKKPVLKINKMTTGFDL